MEATSIDYDGDAPRESADVVRHPALLKHVVPPKGTDVRAVQGTGDAAPVVLGRLMVQ